MTKIQQSTEGLLIAQDSNVVYLNDADLARAIQVRYLFEHFAVSDLVQALAEWIRANAVKQVSIEQVYKWRESLSIERYCYHCDRKVWFEDGDWQCDCLRIPDESLQDGVAKIPTYWGRAIVTKLEE